ncbi:MAG: hypothetical protein E7I26_17480, partial [Enterococcus faecalis]|nr:hypothetical protein [Enterococcus faecalis]
WGLYSAGVFFAAVRFFFYCLLSPTFLLLTARMAVLRRFFTGLPCLRPVLDIRDENHMKIILI